MVTSLLHDIGKLVLVHAYPGYPRQVHGDARTPEERIQRERRELGVDHALVGGVLARRWGLPKSIASVIERHHADDSDGEAALVRLADMLAHYVFGGAISPSELLAVARTDRRLARRSCGPSCTTCRCPSTGSRPRQIDPCPMSREGDRRPAPSRRGHGLQADRQRARALDEHRPHPPAQRLRQARRDGSRPGRADRHRARLDLAGSTPARLTAADAATIAEPDDLDHDQVAVRRCSALVELLPLRRRRPGPDRRARPSGRDPGPVPRAAVRDAAARRSAALAARRRRAATASRGPRPT